MASQFVLSENPDGSVTLTQKKQVFAEVCGKVTYINTKNRKLFKIHAEKMNRTFRCFLSYDNPFCPIREGDAIFGLAEYTQDPRYGDTLNILQPPFVVLGEDKNTIIKNFTTALRGSGFGTMKAHKLLESIILKTGSITNAINNLDRMSSYYNYKKESDPALIQSYSDIIKEKQMLRLLQWWYKNRNLRRLWLLGINNTEIRKSRMAPEEMYKVCLDNPYKLFSLSLDKCEDIANRTGKQPDPTTRKCAEISRSLNSYMERGWSGIPTGILVNMHPDVSQYVSKLKEEFSIKTELHTAYLPYPYEVEVGICDLVCELLDKTTLPHAMHPSEITYTRSDLSQDQKTAIEKALSENICVIKGGAGTGKTTTIKEIVHNLEEKGIKYKVVSFTGKAVARIREVIEKKEPMTMHLTITMSGKQKTEFNHLIIDEASMVTSELLYEFIEKFGSDYRITLIGDPNQLTPIGWGTMFDQLIKSGVVPTYTLSMCHRVDGISSGILLNANSIVECSDPHYNGPPFEFDETDDFNIVDGDLDVVKELITILQDNGIPNDKITVICPFNKDLVQINKICQDIYNSIKRCVTDDQGTKWRINDRVMMTENNYKINVMNGEEGMITDLTASQLEVTFKDGSSHIFSLNTLTDTDDEMEMGCKKILTTSSLTHSFGVSVHRYQGSESDHVIFYIPESKPSKFLNRNLLYTGITRAKKIIWMVGDYDTMLRAATTAPAYRCDNLAKRLYEARTVEMTQ
jgi:exodeoxyribonuclease V alpha subunit